MSDLEPTPFLVDAMLAVAENRVRMDVDYRRFLISSRITIGSFYADDEVTNALVELREAQFVRFGVVRSLGLALLQNVEPTSRGAEWLARAEQESQR